MPRRGFTVKKNWDNPVEHAMPAVARVPAEVRLGAVVVRPATVLAPMAGVTDTVFRRFIRHASLFSTADANSNANLLSQVPKCEGPGAPNSSVDESQIDSAISNVESGCGLDYDRVHVGGWAGADAGDKAAAVSDVLRR